MSLPMATTTVTVRRSVNDGTRDLYDPPAAPSTVARNVRAVISSPSGRTTLLRGERVVVSATFRADPCDVAAGDTLVDDTTGAAYEVLSAVARYELGLGYTAGDLRHVEGAPA